MSSPATEPPSTAEAWGDTADTAPAPDRSAPPGLSDRALLAITAAVTLPIFWLGYGTDIDVRRVLLAGDLIRNGDYAPSRNPGVPVVETIVGLLDPVGGHILVNLATAAALAFAVVGIARLVRAWGHDNGDLVALAFLASPVTLIAGTSTGDFIWALAFFVWGALAHLRGRSLPAGLLFGLAIGSRSTTLLLVLALLVADGWDRAHRRRCVATAAVALPLGAALFIPSWLAFDRSLGFLTATEGWRSFANNVGRLAVKNYAAAGLALVVVVAAALPALARSLRRWTLDPLLRFAVLGLAATEVLFLLVPWKLAHLIPCLLALVLWVAASERNRRPFLWLMIGAIALNGIVAFRPLTADQPNNSESASFEPAIVLGLLLNDIGCRIDFMDEPARLGTGAWDCTLEPVRGPSEGVDTGPGG
ncbi:MAG: glycosyltransferase 87 family protein [Acidimicrobiales bacterium]